MNTPAPDDAPEPTAPDGRDRLPSRTTPTWEMELLVSGGTIFGLLQVPGALDRWYFRAVNAAGVDIATVLKLLYIYTKIALVTLLLTFVVHLFLRGYWVALVGLDSVYPGGVRLDGIRMGPIARRVAATRLPRMGAAIDAADNRATRTFGIGFGFALMMLAPAAMMLFGLGGAVLVQPLLGLANGGLFFAAVVVVLLLPWFVVASLDREGPSAPPPGSRSERVVTGTLGLYSRLGMGMGSNLLLALFWSHENRWRILQGWLLVMLPVMALMIVQGRAGDRDLLADRVLAEPPGARALPVYYADAGLDRSVALPGPWIASRVATGPYLQVFVPWLPRRHLPALRKACPAAAAAAEASDGAPPTQPALRACVARLIDLRLDGRPVAVAFDDSADPQTGQRGLLVMLPMRDLPPGRHVLSLSAPQLGAANRSTLQRTHIPFWR